MRARLIRAVAGAAVVCGIATAAWPATAGAPSTCITADESAAFGLRHLQSRLMVAGLACNQRDAYNTFVESFRPSLTDAGAVLIDYFRRSGGGQTALNSHVTDLANIAGLRRAEDPEGFCRETWSIFLLLQERPAALETQALAHVTEKAGLPEPCAAPANAPPPPEVTAETQSVVKAAVDIPTLQVD